MVRYSKAAQEGEVKCRGDGLRVSFKNTSNTVNAIKGMTLHRAKRYLKNVLAKKEIIPFRRFKGDVGRAAQAKIHGVSQGRWPTKSAKIVLELLENAASNAEMRSIDVDTLRVTHGVVQRAPHMRRRTYRAHGRINQYQSSPSHIELIFSPDAEAVPRPEDDTGRTKKKISQKKLKKERMRRD